MVGILHLLEFYWYLLVDLSNISSLSNFRFLLAVRIVVKQCCLELNYAQLIISEIREQGRENGLPK